MHLLGRARLDNPARRPDGKLFRGGRLELEGDAVGARVVEAERGGDVLAELEAEAELRRYTGLGRGKRFGHGWVFEGEQGKGRGSRGLPLSFTLALSFSLSLLPGFSAPGERANLTWVQLEELPGRHDALFFSFGFCFASYFSQKKGRKEERLGEAERK